MAVDSKRERIMAEVERRLRLAYPDADVKRGYFGQKTETDNKFYIYDLPETMERDRHGQYTCTFAVSIAYFVTTSPELMFATGSQHLESVRLALETSERFKDTQDNVLAIDFFYDEGALLYYEEGVLDVELIFQFQYVKDAGWLKKPAAAR